MNGMYLEASFDQVYRSWRRLRRNMKGACLNFLEQRRDELIIEGKSSNEEDIEDNTTTPNVYLGASIQLSANNFRCSIIWTSTTGFEEITICHDIAETEVGNFDIH